MPFSFSSIVKGLAGWRLRWRLFAPTLQDISERVALEAQLRRAQKMDALGQLAGGIAHDFNNVLTVIESYSSMLLTDLGVEGEVRDDVMEIQRAARRAAQLTRQLLAFSRQQVLMPRLLDVNEAIAGVDMMLRRLIGEDIEFRTTLGADLHYVMADPTQVEQVLVNLVVNARDAMPDGGVLTIETANVELDESFNQRTAVQRPGPHVMLAVSDTGTGIAPEIVERIFEPFFTTKDQGRGTGLGLSTVQGIVEQSGGHVWVYSEPGHGSTFKIYLPRAEGADLSVPVVAPPAPLRRGGHETILLVEDDNAVRSVAISTLRRAGHTVIEASNGAEAIRAIETGRSIDLIITDMVMPVMGGRALALELERRGSRIPMLFMSGYTRIAVPEDQAFRAGRAFVEKPFTPDVLMGKVRDVLGQRAATSAGFAT